jgi:hypothetical protein
MRSYLSLNFSTRYDVSGDSGSLQSNYEDARDQMAYIKSSPNATTASSLDWANVATIWGLSLGLDEGAVLGNASISRLLT